MGEHGGGIIVLHPHIFQVDVDPLDIYLHRHAVVEEGDGDVAQLLQTGDIGLDQTDLLGGALSEVIHFGDLEDQLLSSLLVTELVDLVHPFGNIESGIDRLVVEWHLELQSGRGVILECLRHVVGLAVFRSIRH